MLYATTRNNTDSYTDHRTLMEDLPPNGGLFIPFRIPKLDAMQINAIKDKTFGETVADILNLFYTNRITSWDIDCRIGKTPVKIISADRKVILASFWNNPNGNYQYLCSNIYNKLCDGNRNVPTQWANIAIRVALLFGIYNILQKNQVKTFDICVNAGDFIDPMAAWYARYMGLPIGNIICTSDEDSPIWDFLHKGELSTVSLDSVAGIERLICTSLGFEQVRRYLECCEQKGVFRVDHNQLQMLNRDMFVSVVGAERSDAVISAFWAANNILLDPNTAISYGGLQDFRAKTGESRPTVLLWDDSPLLYTPAVRKATGLEISDIKKHIDKY